MARLDIIHHAVKNALVKDGWLITDDPYIIEYEEVTLYADLGAERMLAAEKVGSRIVVEVKSFLHSSRIQDLKLALGQYNLYLSYLEVTAPDRKLYLAIADKIYVNFFVQKAIQLVIERFQLSLLVVNVDREEVVEWIR